MPFHNLNFGQNPPPQIQSGQGDEKLRRLHVLAGQMADEQSSREKASELTMMGFTYLLRAAQEDKSIAPAISKAIGNITKGFSQRQVPEQGMQGTEGKPPSRNPRNPIFGQTRSPIIGEQNAR